MMNIARLGALACAAVSVLASQHAAAMTFAVNEGATYRVSDAEIQQKYKALADDLSKIVGDKVTVVPVSDYKAIADGLAAGKFDLAYIHPTHVAMKGLTSDGYQPVALTKGFTEYRAYFLVRKDSTAQSVADFKGKTLGTPSPDSITAVLTRSTLREGAADAAEAVKFVPSRYQDAIPFMVENRLVDAGVTGSESVAKAWAQAGGRIAFSSKPVPVKLVIASKSVSAEHVAQVQSYFVSLEQSDKGRKTLEAIDKKGFVPFDANGLAAVNKLIATGVRQ